MEKLPSDPVSPPTHKSNQVNLLWGGTVLRLLIRKMKNSPKHALCHVRRIDHIIHKSRLTTQTTHAQRTKRQICVSFVNMKAQNHPHAHSLFLPHTHTHTSSRSGQNTTCVTAVKCTIVHDLVQKEYCYSSIHIAIKSQVPSPFCILSHNSRRQEEARVGIHKHTVSTHFGYHCYNCCS